MPSSTIGARTIDDSQHCRKKSSDHTTRPPVPCWPRDAPVGPTPKASSVTQQPDGQERIPGDIQSPQRTPLIRYKCRYRTTPPSDAPITYQRNHQEIDMDRQDLVIIAVWYLFLHATAVIRPPPQPPLTLSALLTIRNSKANDKADPRTNCPVFVMYKSMHNKHSTQRKAREGESLEAADAAIWY